MIAEDIKFAMDYTMNPRNGAYGLSRLSRIERVEASDLYTLKVYMKTANPASLTGGT